MWAWCKTVNEVVSICGCVCVHELIWEQVHLSEYINVYLSMFMSSCVHGCLSGFMCVTKYSMCICVKFFFSLMNLWGFWVFGYVKMWGCSLSECMNIGICVNKHLTICVTILICILLCVHSCTWLCDYIHVWIDIWTCSCVSECYQQFCVCEHVHVSENVDI